jgi:1-acyl-sn-glycerol-3-phosphate acyltransferase
MIAIDRAGGMGALKDMLKKVAATTLEAQRPVVIFPQGTRTLIGQQAPYQVGISALYNTGNYYVVPVALNTGKFWAKGGFVKKPGTYVIEFLPSIAPGLAKEEFMRKLETQIETASAALL